MPVKIQRIPMSEENWSKKHILAYIALVAVSLLFMLWLAGLLTFGKISPGAVARKAAAPPAKVFTVQEVDIPQELTVVAQVMTQTLTQVSAQVSGRVHEIWVEAGDRVKGGDPLVYLRGPEYHARAEQARAGAAQAQANLTQVSGDYERYRRLLKEGAVSPREFEAMEAKHRSAQAALAQAQAQVKEAQAFRDYTLITSPLTGVVAERRTAAGDLAQPGQPLVTLYDPRQLQIEGEVNDTYRERVRPRLPVRLEVPAADWQGESNIAEVFPISAPGSRTFKVRTGFLRIPGDQDGGVTPPQRKPTLTPGMFARLYLPLGQTRGLVIPKTAVREIGQLTMVEVLVDGRPSRRQVKLGREIGEQVEVLAGLQTGEQVILP